MILAPKGCAAKASVQIPLTVLDNTGKPAASALLLIAHKMPDVLQVAFFEALPKSQEAVDALIDRARAIAGQRSLSRIVIGIDGHVNNGLGFLVGKHDSPPSFGVRYNPPYYIDYFTKRAAVQGELRSYFYDLTVSNLDRERKLIERISRRFKVRQGNFKDMRSEMRIYTELNNTVFKDHPLYFERAVEEDYELFKSFGPFLKEENFLVSELDGVPIGFLLWYPDFHELVKPGGTLGLGTALKYRLPGNGITRFKIAEIGVMPEHQGSAAIAGLINECVEITTRNGHSFCESGWILSSNTKSRGLTERWAKDAYKTYLVFEIHLEGEDNE